MRHVQIMGIQISDVSRQHVEPSRTFPDTYFSTLIRLIEVTNDDLTRRVYFDEKRKIRSFVRSLIEKEK